MLDTRSDGARVVLADVPKVPTGPVWRALCLFALACAQSVKMPRPYLNHGDATMNCSVECFGSLLTGCLDETEDLAAVFIEPVLQELDALLVLSLKIVVMGSCDCFGSHPFHVVVDIYEEWHAPSLLCCEGSLCRALSLCADPIRGDDYEHHTKRCLAAHPSFELILVRAVWPPTAARLSHVQASPPSSQHGWPLAIADAACALQALLQGE